MQSTAHIRKALTILAQACCVLSACFALGASNDGTSLKSLYESHRWFELRDSVQKGAAPLFYQGAVACAFNDLHDCEKKLAKVIKSEPHS